MYTIEFYTDANGNEPIADYIRELGLRAQTSKDARIKYKKIIEYFLVLEANGTLAGMPYVKHIEGDIWELRPNDDRIFFFYWVDEKYVMLHYFHKKTQKMPAREFEQAKRNLQDWLDRHEGE